MESTLNALGAILLKAVPTLLILLFLHIYLKKMFFQPLERVLSARYDATEGARLAAEQSLRRAEQKAAAFESAMQVARLDLYREQENTRERHRQQQVMAIEEAQQRAQQAIDEAHRQLDKEGSAAREQLLEETERLADLITARVLRGRAA